MKTGLRGQLLPQSAADAEFIFHENRERFRICQTCGKNLSDHDAASSERGWQETQISGLCEPCFDLII